MIVLQKNIDKTEQYDHPPQAALSFTAILKNNEILLLLKIAEVKVRSDKVSTKLDSFRFTRIPNPSQYIQTQVVPLQKISGHTQQAA